MSSNSSCRCSSEHQRCNDAQISEPLQQHIRFNHRDRRKDTVYTCLMTLFKDAAQLLALLVAALCARIIQTYIPVPHLDAPAIDRARAIQLLGFSARLETVRRLVEDNLGEVLQIVPRIGPFDRTMVKALQPFQTTHTNLSIQGTNKAPPLTVHI